MSRTVTISDDLAALLAARQRQMAYPSLDAAAEAIITHGLAADDPNDDHRAGLSDEELRNLIDQAEASGPVVRGMRPPSRRRCFAATRPADAATSSAG